MAGVIFNRFTACCTVLVAVLIHNRFEIALAQTCISLNGSHFWNHVVNQNCTHIVGNVAVKLDSHSKFINFFANVEEVTGYVFIEYHGGAPANFTFPNLKIIRGETQYSIGMENVPYAFLVINKHTTKFRLELPALREISNGSVGVYTIRRMRFLETIDWTQILADSRAQFKYFSCYRPYEGVYACEYVSASRRNCNCHPSCIGGCWGVGGECQQLLGSECSTQCKNGLCFGPNAHECCHSLCVGGCSGPGPAECDICKHVKYDGECRESCPTGMFSFGFNCVSSCPNGSALDEEMKACLGECPVEKVSIDGKCVQAPSHIRKCKMRYPTSPLNALTMTIFKSCNVYDGNIFLDKTSISLRYNLTSSIHIENYQMEDLEHLRSIRVITGDVTIMTQNFKKLDSFRNLEEIGGALGIAYTYLTNLYFPVLRRVNGTVTITRNRNLSYVDTINWKNIVSADYLKSYMIVITRNKKEIVKEIEVCSAHCSINGCFGPEPDQCICNEYRQEGRCVSSCNLKNGNLTDGPYCVNSCPKWKFALDGKCVFCHEDCKNGCTGPGMAFGIGGCNYEDIKIETRKKACAMDEDNCTAISNLKTDESLNEAGASQPGNLSDNIFSKNDTLLVINSFLTFPGL